MFLLLFPDPFDPPRFHLNLIDLENLFFVPLQYLLSHKSPAVLLELLKPAKCSLVLGHNHVLFLPGNEYLLCEAILNIPEELIEPRVEVL